MASDSEPDYDAGHWSETVRCMAAHLSEVVREQRTMPEELSSGPHAHARGFIAAAIAREDSAELAIAVEVLQRCRAQPPRTLAAAQKHLAVIAEVLQWLSAQYMVIGPDLANAREAHAFFRQCARDAAVAPERGDGEQKNGEPEQSVDGERRHG